MTKTIAGLRRAAPLLIFGLWGLAVGLAGPASALADEVVFRVQVANLGLAGKHLDRGKTTDEAVQIVLPGTFATTPQEFRPVAREEADNGTPGGAVQSDFSAWKADDPAWIKDNFAQADQKALGQFLDSAEIREGSRKGFAPLESVFLWGVVRYGDYALAMITYGQGETRNHGMVASLVQEDGAWKRTNALSTDETMDVVWTAFRMGQVVARP